MGRHLLERVPISDLCNESEIRPNQFYTWQKQLSERGASAFEVQRGYMPNQFLCVKTPDAPAVG